jgi:PAS domain S-box-containing protein
MEAMRMNALLVYDVYWFIASILTAYIFACAAIYMIKARSQPSSSYLIHRFTISPIMGLSMAGMHYSAMTAASFYVLDKASMMGEHAPNARYVALAVASLVVILCAITFIASMVDRRMQHTEYLIEVNEIREQGILNNLAEGVVIIDENGLIESINSVGLTMFGYQRENIEARPISFLIPSFDMTLFHSKLVNYMETQHFTLDGNRYNDSIFPIEVSLASMSMPNHKSKVFNCVIRDISSRLALELQLRQAQKLESIGQLATGIAHEINTPAQYVSDNTVFLRDGFQTTLQVLEKIRLLAESDDASLSIDELKQHILREIEEGDLDFIAQETPLAFEQSLEGLARVGKIVKAMKSFSHTNNQTQQQVDIAEAIDSTITIARGEWKYVAEIETKFDSDLPKLPCYRDEFNQVILNMVINAAHAIEEKFSGKTGQLGLITISTHKEQDMVLVRIKDNGSGMPKDVMDRVFDPFFTTKGVGKGSGQGLSLAYSVIKDMHGGNIDVKSKVGEGTVFTISLPARTTDVSES